MTVSQGGSTRGNKPSRATVLRSNGINTGQSEEKQRVFRAAMEELEALVGLHEVKELVKQLCAYVEIQRRRRLARLAADNIVLHMVFKGNPGTGKTTVARVMGRLLNGLGVLEQGHVVEVERADMVGEYIGHTAQKTREQIKKALGGVLFVDEAYSLARGGEKDFGKEAIDTIVKEMEDKKTEFVLILAGYRDEMEFFLQCNPGLRSRFPIQIDFPDFTVEELADIADIMIQKRQYRLTTGARAKLMSIVSRELRAHPKNFGNARLVRNIVEKAIRRQAVRLVAKPQTSRSELMMITREDIAL